MSTITWELVWIKKSRHQLKFGDFKVIKQICDNQAVLLLGNLGIEAESINESDNLPNR